MRSIYAMGSEKTFEGTHRNQRPDNGLLSFASNAVRCLPSGRCRRVHWPPRRVTRGELYTVNPAMWPCTTKLLWTQLLPLSETAFRLCVRVNKWASFHGGVCKLQTRPEFSLCRCCYITTACRAAPRRARQLSPALDGRWSKQRVNLHKSAKQTRPS